MTVRKTLAVALTAFVAGAVIAMPAAKASDPVDEDTTMWGSTWTPGSQTFPDTGTITLPDGTVIQIGGGGSGGGTFPGAGMPDMGGAGLPGMENTETTETSEATEEEAAGLALINTDVGWGSGQAAGTGMVIDPDGLVVTNHHVVEGSTEVSVTIAETGQTYDAEVLGYDDVADVAVLQLVGASGLTTVTATSDEVEVGDSITSVGNANGAGELISATGTVTSTDVDITVSNDDGTASNLADLIEVSAAMVPGVSGGALLDDTGKVVGMNVAGSSDTRQEIGYAIPVTTVVEVAQNVVSGTQTESVTIGRTAGLGVQVSTQARMSTLPTGVLVVGVIADGPAEQAGVTAGSTLTAVAGTPITTAEDLSRVLASMDPGAQTDIVWIDSAGAEHSATITCTEAPLA